MPESVASSSPSPLRFEPDGASAEEIEARASLPPSQTCAAPASHPGVLETPVAEPPDAVKQLVKNFTPPASRPPPAEPSTLKALLANVPEMLGTTLACVAAAKAPNPLSAGACVLSVVMTSKKLGEHVAQQQKDQALLEAAQVRRDATLACREQGGAPLLTADEEVLCYDP